MQGAAPVLGIDLGTTNSVVAVATGPDPRVLPASDGLELTPSIVSFHPSGKVLVGKKAKDRRLIDAANTIYSVKRLIGRPFESPEVRMARERFAFEMSEGPNGGVLVTARGEKHTLPEISAFVLRAVRARAEETLGIPCSRAIITVPANFNELQRSATKAAGKVAGLEVLRILNEPTAAAVAYGCETKSRERIAVFDLGGGTFDITLLELSGNVYEVLATAGDTFLGGDDVDVAITEKMAEVFLEQNRYDPRQDPNAFERLRAAAEWAKIALSSQEKIELKVEELAYGQGGQPLHLDFAMTHSELDKLARPIIAKSFSVCGEAMKTASLTPTQLDRIIMVGGQTRMPLVRDMVRQYFGKEPMTDLNPDTVVACGAAVQGRALGERRALGRMALKKVLVPRPGAAIEEMAATGANRPRSLGAPPPPPPMNGSKAPGPPHGLPELPALPAEESNAGLPKAPLPAFDPLRSLDPIADFDTGEFGAVGGAGGPLLLDVTPLTLGVQTVGGYCEAVIPRNAPIPAEQSKIFTTAKDNQRSVRVLICQGESRRLEENQGLGQIELKGLPVGARGKVQIDVTFMLDADGTLGVHARDLATGMEQSISISLVGGIEDSEIEQMRNKQQGRVEV